MSNEEDTRGDNARLELGFGGMAEYVHHEVNGLQFEHRSVQSMAVQMQRFVDDPAWARRLGERGYVFSKSGDVPDIKEHVKEVEQLYRRVLSNKNSAKVNKHG